MDNATKTLHQFINIIDRKKIEADGVESIASFEDGYIVLDTSFGQIGIEGDGLKIVDLSKESGKITVIGKINSVVYLDSTKKKGLFR